MSYRKRQGNLSDDDESDKEVVTSDAEDIDEGPSAKRSRNVWSDMLMEEQLKEKSSKINLEEKAKGNQRKRRGVETYDFPPNSVLKKHELLDTMPQASDDPFGDVVTLAPEEKFGVKRTEKKQPNGWWSEKGLAKKYGGPAAAARLEAGQTRKRNHDWAAKKTEELVTKEYSLDALAVAEFVQGTPIDQLAKEIGEALGETNPETIIKIVTCVGEEIALKLFEETREVEKKGGMMTNDGKRRRTPGGTYITLFRGNTAVTQAQKDAVFNDMRQMEKEKSRSRKKTRNFNRKLEDVKATLEMVKKQETEMDSNGSTEVEEPTKPTADGDIEMTPHCEEVADIV